MGEGREKEATRNKTSPMRHGKNCPVTRHMTFVWGWQHRNSGAVVLHNSLLGCDESWRQNLQYSASRKVEDVFLASVHIRNFYLPLSQALYCFFQKWYCSSLLGLQDECLFCIRLAWHSGMEIACPHDKWNDGGRHWSMEFKNHRSILLSPLPECAWIIQPPSSTFKVDGTEMEVLQRCK